MIMDITGNPAHHAAGVQTRPPEKVEEEAEFHNGFR
jgi:hypothetical protein